MTWLPQGKMSLPNLSSEIWIPVKPVQNPVLYSPKLRWNTFEACFQYCWQLGKPKYKDKKSCHSESEQHVYSCCNSTTYNYINISSNGGSLLHKNGTSEALTMKTNSWLLKHKLDTTWAMEAAILGPEYVHQTRNSSKWAPRHLLVFFPTHTKPIVLASAPLRTQDKHSFSVANVP